MGREVGQVHGERAQGLYKKKCVIGGACGQFLGREGGREREREREREGERERQREGEGIRDTKEGEGKGKEEEGEEGEGTVGFREQFMFGF